jgi:hypothetical protein
MNECMYVCMYVSLYTEPVCEAQLDDMSLISTNVATQYHVFLHQNNI